MPGSLSTIRGNFWSDMTSLAAFPFTEPTGDFRDLVNPARVLTVSGSDPAIARIAGVRGSGVGFRNGRYLAAPNDFTWNAIGAFEGWTAISLFFRHTAFPAANDGLGVSSGSANLSQYWIDLEGPAVRVLNSSDAGPLIDSGSVPTANVWYHLVAQIYRNGAGSAADLKLRVAGTDYPTISGSTAITPNPTTATPFEVGRILGNLSNQLDVCQLLVWKSSTNPLDEEAMDDLSNNETGVDFVLDAAVNELLSGLGMGRG